MKPTASGASSVALHPSRRSDRIRASERLKTWWSKRRQQPPFNWPRRRKLRWLVAFVLLLLAYPVLGTLALWSGLVEHILESEDLRVEIEHPAYTIWPGRVRMKHVRILQNGTTQFILEGEDLVINVRMLELFRRRVHVTELAAHDVLYQMRVQVKDTKGIERRLAAYPPLNGLPGENTLLQNTAEKRKESDPDWTVRVEGLDVAVKELWFFEYRYLGKGHLRGGFMVGPNVMQVSTAVQDVGPGDLRFGLLQPVATELRGQITADIPKLNPKEHANASFMELVTARVNLRATVLSLEVVGAYFPGLEVSRGRGPLSLDLYLDRGKLGDKSHLDYGTESVHLKGNGYGVSSDWQVAFDAKGSPDRKPLLRSSSKLSYVSLARGRRDFTLQLPGHHEEAELDTIQLSRSTDLQHASLRIPKILSTDLQDLPAVLLPEGLPIRIDGGTCAAALSLDMDNSYWAHGPLTASIKALDMNAAGVHIGGDLKFDAALHFNPKTKVNQLQNLLFTVRDLNMQAGSRTVSAWWLNVQSKQLNWWSREPSRFEGTLGIRARDLDPVLKALAEKDVISKLIPMFTSLSDFRATTTISASGPVTDVTIASESDIWDIAGRVYKNGKQSQLALVVGGQAVSLGIASKGDGLELMPFAKTGWLNEHLRDFPKPLVQMSGDKP